MLSTVLKDPHYELLRCAAELGQMQEWTSSNMPSKDKLRRLYNSAAHGLKHDATTTATPAEYACLLLVLMGLEAYAMRLLLALRAAKPCLAALPPSSSDAPLQSQPTKYQCYCNSAHLSTHLTKELPVLPATSDMQDHAGLAS
jgi:hypothetical protein